MICLRELNLLSSKSQLSDLPEGKLLINTINAYSYNNARKDDLFSEALQKGDILIPDGISIVKACRLINAKCQPKERIAGWDLFEFEMQKLNNIANPDNKKKVMFMGSSNKVLEMISRKVCKEYPNLETITFSPPYKTCFDDEDNRIMVEAINNANPDLLWIGMTAPKQEKWTYQNWNNLNIHCHVGTIGAVFDFFAGSTKRAPISWQNAGLEWLYRLMSEPKRMWRRYIIGNAKFIAYMLLEKIHR